MKNKFYLLILSAFLLTGCRNIELESNLKQMEIYVLRQNYVVTNERKAIQILTEKIEDLTKEITELSKMEEKKFKIIMDLQDKNKEERENEWKHKIHTI